MKSKQVEKIETSCKHCIFAQWDEKDQVGCLANKLDKYGFDDIQEVYDDENNFYVINKLCMGFRNKEWNDGVADVQKMVKENNIPLTIVYFCEHWDEKDFQNVQSCLRNLDYPKLEVVFGHSELFPRKKEMSKLLRKLTYNSIRYNIVQYYSELPEHLKEVETLKKITGTYFCVGKPSYSDLNKELHAINNFINVNMEKFVTCKGQYLFSSTLLLNPIYKESLRQYLNDVVEHSKTANLHKIW